MNCFAVSKGSRWSLVVLSKVYFEIFLGKISSKLYSFRVPKYIKYSDIINVKLWPSNFPWQLYLVFNAIFDVCSFLDEVNIFIIVFVSYGKISNSCNLLIVRCRGRTGFRQPSPLLLRMLCKIMIVTQSAKKIFSRR